MTAIQFILIIVSILLILMGILVLTRSIKSTASSYQTVLPEGVQQKDGLPILPRHMRDFADEGLDDEPYLDDTVDEIAETTAETQHSIAGSSDKTMVLEPLQPSDSEVSSVTSMGVDTNSSSNSFNHSFNQPVSHVSMDTMDNDDEAVSQNNPVKNVPSSVSNMALVEDDNTSMMTNDIANKDSTELTDSAPVLNQHLSDNEQVTQNNPLYTAQETLNINILPNNEFASIKGTDLLKMVEHYGFKFGEMNMFHRYQNKDGTGILWFSMMGLTSEGISPFDLHTISHNEYKGLALFLSLPHPKVFQGFDSMMSIASLMARELDAQVVDDHSKVITPNYKKVLRAQLEENYGQPV